MCVCVVVVKADAVFVVTKSCPTARVGVVISVVISIVPPAEGSEFTMGSIEKGAILFDSLFPEYTKASRSAAEISYEKGTISLSPGRK